MISTFAFTDGRVDALQPADRRYIVRDTRTPGLILRVQPTGTKSYWLCLWYEGKTRWVKLGKHPSMSVKMARDEYVLKRSQLGANGEVARNNAMKYVTLNEVWRQFMDLNPSGLTESTIRNRDYLYRRRIANNIGRRFLHEIRPKDIEACKARALKEVEGRTANEVITIVRILFRWAVEMEMLPANYPVPTAAVRRAKVKGGRTRRLHSDEFRAFLDALEQYGRIDHPDRSPEYYRTVCDALKVMLFTGARSSNVKSMEWTEINLDTGVWEIPATKTKTGREYMVPLTSQVVDIIRRRHAGRAGECRYVFPGWGKSEHLGELRRSFQAIRTLAGIENLTIHDLRRTQGSVQASIGINQAMIGESLCHADIKSTAIYTRSSGMDQLRSNMERANRAMLGVAPGAEVSLTVEDWREIVEVLGSRPLAAKVQGMLDLSRVA